MIGKFSWLLLPSLLLPSVEAKSDAMKLDSPAIARLDDIHASLVKRDPAGANQGGGATQLQRLAQWWRNWSNWLNYR
jgi:hypothetical protein